MPPPSTDRPAVGQAANLPAPPVPLGQRKLDWLFLGFFLINLFFITYIVDLEQLVIADPSPGQFAYPLWPPAALVDLVHWWGHRFDPVLLARPVWWRATIWIDALFFGPYYAVALYAFVRGRDFIRLPSLVWASVMMTNVTIILFEELLGPHATPARGVVLLANAPWLLFPLLMLWRMGRLEAPFARSANAGAAAGDGDGPPRS
jgi:hypothetical protein